jgi:hypothetical protein
MTYAVLEGSILGARLDPGMDAFEEAPPAC